jgi:hypothetical protein
MTLSKENLAILQSYGRSFLGAAVALYLAGVTDPYLYLNAFVAAIAPVALRYFNKNDIAFGKISGKSTPDEVAVEVTKAVKAAVTKKAPAKKAVTTAKKSTAKKTTSK